MTNWREAVPLLKTSSIIKTAEIVEKDTVQHINSGQRGEVKKIDRGELVVDLGNGNLAIWDMDEVNKVAGQPELVEPSPFNIEARKVAVQETVADEVKRMLEYRHVIDNLGRVGSITAIDDFIVYVTVMFENKKSESTRLDRLKFSGS